jgi:Uma2 family endonuclease
MSTTETASAHPTGPLEPKARIVLGGVSWDLYEELREIQANRHIQMAYDDGDLELMSPSFRHEVSSRRLASFVGAVTTGLGLPCLDAGRTTLKPKGAGKKQGKAIEADSCFFLANERKMRGKTAFGLDVDPPPDLAIVVDQMDWSEESLPIYAALGVPEVWRFDGVSLSFDRLQADGTYETRESSQALLMVTPKVVLRWMGRIDAVGETQWFLQVQGWARAELVQPHRPA